MHKPTKREDKLVIIFFFNSISNKQSDENFSYKNKFQSTLRAFAWFLLRRTRENAPKIQCNIERFMMDCDHFTHDGKYQRFKSVYLTAWLYKDVK